MYAAEVGSTPAFLNEACTVLQAVAVAMLAGWVAERTVDTGLRIRGIGPLTGLIGVYAGSRLWAWSGWDTGPLLGGLAIVPALAGAFGVCAVLKLVSVGLAGPRW
jgi:uncharacterized membrane protein YeaQ/YmgE (transglycosylase-associated protein family)